MIARLRYLLARWVSDVRAAQQDALLAGFRCRGRLIQLTENAAAALYAQATGRPHVGQFQPPELVLLECAQLHEGCAGCPRFKAHRQALALAEGGGWQLQMLTAPVLRESEGDNRDREAAQIDDFQRKHPSVGRTKRVGDAQPDPGPVAEPRTPGVEDAEHGTEHRRGECDGGDHVLVHLHLLRWIVCTTQHLAAAIANATGWRIVIARLRYLLARRPPDTEGLGPWKFDQHRIDAGLGEIAGPAARVAVELATGWKRKRADPAPGAVRDGLIGIAFPSSLSPKGTAALRVLLGSPVGRKLVFKLLNALHQAGVFFLERSALLRHQSRLLLEQLDPLAQHAGRLHVAERRDQAPERAE